MFQLDGNVTSILLAIITGIMGIYSQKLSSKQEKANKKVEEQGKLFKRIGELSNQIAIKTEEKNRILNQIGLLTLKSNIAMLHYALEDNEKAPLEEKARELETKYNSINEELDDLYEEYKILKGVSSKKE